MSQQRPVAIFRTKADILTARDIGNVQIADEVLRHDDFVGAKMNDLLGFKAISGSDFKIIAVQSIKDNPQAFFKLAFGEKA